MSLGPSFCSRCTSGSLSLDNDNNCPFDTACLTREIAESSSLAFIKSWVLKCSREPTSTLVGNAQHSGMTSGDTPSISTHFWVLTVLHRALTPEGDISCQSGSFVVEEKFRERATASMLFFPGLYCTLKLYVDSQLTTYDQLH